MDKLLRQSKPKGRKAAAAAAAEGSERLYCLCRQPDSTALQMICCDVCEDWFHYVCVNLTSGEANSIEKYVCVRCKRMKPHLFSKSASSCCRLSLSVCLCLSVCMSQPCTHAYVLRQPPSSRSPT